MTEPAPAILDVRPILADGGEPFGEIMATVAGLGPGQALRLIAPFKPVPLFVALQKKGFSHTERPLDGGDWEVLFRPGGDTSAPPAAANTEPSTPWPAPSRDLDNRGLMPPEPMVRILETLEAMAAGEVLEVFNDREPVLLYPELAKRGHAIRIEPRSAGGFRLLICHGGAAETVR